MKKLINILFIFAMVLAFASCEKEDIRPHHEKDGFNCFSMDEDGNTRAGLDGGDNSDDLIRDPDDDEDFDEDEDLIVDPDDDEDYDENEGGIVDPDDDEDYDEDEGK